MPPNFRDDLNAVAVGPDGRTYLAVGEDGSILISVNGGKDWIYRDGKTRFELNAIAFDGKTAVFVGMKSTILFLDLSDGATPENAPVQVARDGSSVAAEIIALQIRLRTLEENIKTLNNQEKLILIDESKFGVESVWQLFFRTNSYRIAILLIVFFAAQQLFTMARYNVRLAAFYRARADAITLASQAGLPWPGVPRSLNSSSVRWRPTRWISAGRREARPIGCSTWGRC